jgi:type II secretory pathway pseudopilin PulG
MSVTGRRLIVLRADGWRARVPRRGGAARLFAPGTTLMSSSTLPIDHQKNTANAHRARRAFSVTELLVVIGIILLLVGILLPALRNARESGKRTKTIATMQEFIKACEAFQQDHGRYPGIVPEDILASSPSISGTENMLLDLLGGARLLTPQDPAGGPVDVNYNNFGGTEIVFGSSGYSLRFDVKRIGEGPVINGKPHAPYFSPKADEFGPVIGQVDPVNGNTPQLNGFPDLLDAWGQPIMAIRARGSTGPLVGAVGAAPLPQFYGNGLLPYLNSPGLGEFGFDQIYSAGTNPAGSILTVAAQQQETLAQIIRNPAFGAPDDPLNQGNAKGRIVLFSAGPDGIYFSAHDGPGSPGNPDIDIIDAAGLSALQKNEYDDIVQAGGA